jgi:hypothetical protein
MKFKVIHYQQLQRPRFSAMHPLPEPALRLGNEIVFTVMMRRLLDAGDDVMQRCKYAKEVERLMRRDSSFRQFVMDVIDLEISADAEGQSAMEQGQRRLILMFLSAEDWPLGTETAAEAHRTASRIEYCAIFGPNACDV